MAHIGIRPAAQAAGAANEVGAAARESARQAAPWVEPMARVGFVAKALVYITIAWLALKAALGVGGAFTNSKTALTWIDKGPLGLVALGVIALGALAFALYSLVAAATGAEETERGAKGAALRLGQAGTGLAYGALGVQAIRVLLTHRSGANNAAQSWTAKVLGMPFGRAIVIAVGAFIVGYALHQLYVAFAKDPHDDLDLSTAGPTTAKVVEHLARFGVAARAVVLVLIGWFLVRAALHYNPNEAGGVDISLATLGSQPYGRIMLGVVALGLLAFGIYSFAEAKWRRMRMA